MARLKERTYTYFKTVRGMCRSCRRIVPARVFFQDGKVWQQSLCSQCDNDPALIAGDQEWYLEKMGQTYSDHAPLPGAHPPVNGCPHDCGPCSWHASPCQLPVVSVTNACNLKCPICFTYNRPDQTYFMSRDEMQATVDWIIQAAGQVDLINITGGEPTLHPEILSLLKCCQRPEIGRITMNSNGLRLAEDKDLCRQLADLGVQVILSFNTFDSSVSQRLHGCNVVDAKLKAIDNLGQAGVQMTLLNVLIRDTNETAITGLLKIMRERDHILSLTVQTMTYTGQGGGHFIDRRHIPVDEATKIICDQSEGLMRFSDFLSRPAAHPLCYLTNYLLKCGSDWIPFARFATREKIQSLMADSYLIRLEGEKHFFQDAINDLYARGETNHLKSFRTLIETLFPSGKALSVFDQQRQAEGCVRTVYVHSHMDEGTFDCSRAMHCPDLVPSEPGRLIPACTYNLFYRRKDERFYVKS